MATMVTLLMGNYQLDMTLATACDTDVADYCNMEKNMRQEGDMFVCCVCVRACVRVCVCGHIGTVFLLDMRKVVSYLQVGT